ncbi:uncharacterized protein BP01DRAFT_426669 [Aspergillus saccharolyticus JOP 1030-1]|uniref:Uncharacterized protein n=1 Tax=Aspergillus saccharolyticus JOP 1030-1 TaxID=1450539 RepID=A0A318Z139_9EURO|nr:hypothetical protein BP01DRAFT_426669 [Aspergillus saccharolyticus JOP 1030-1]PYH41005.1 hypothetical protein BP01DRAFT_426669 [Aspergillus saccharolyticus JOP 1030-1]
MELTSAVCPVQATEVSNNACGKIDILRRATQFIICNKQFLSDDLRLSLFEAFGQNDNKSSGIERARTRARDARERIGRATEKDILPTPETLSLIAEIRAAPSKFWTAKLRVSLEWDANILRQLYHGSRENDRLSVTYRAFYTSATYLFVRLICERFNVRIFSERVLRYCTTLIDPNGKEDVESVKKNLKDDYKAGLIWNTYAEHLGGYGTFFLIGVAPAWMFEISLNKRDDLDFVVSHLTSINVPHIAAQYDLHGIGSQIIYEITQRAGSILPSRLIRKNKKSKSNKLPGSSRSEATNSMVISDRIQGRLSSPGFITIPDIKSPGNNPGPEHQGVLNQLQFRADHDSASSYNTSLSIQNTSGLDKDVVSVHSLADERSTLPASGIHQEKVSIFGPSPHGQTSYSPSFDNVVRGFEDVLYHAAGEEVISQNIAEGFEDVNGHRFGVLSSGNFSQRLPDDICGQRESMSILYDIAQGFETAHYQTQLTHDNVIQGFENGIHHTI